MKNHLLKTISIPSPNIPIIQKMKILPYNMASIKATVIIVFLLQRESLSRLNRRNGYIQLREGGFRLRPLQPLAVVG